MISRGAKTAADRVAKDNRMCSGWKIEPIASSDYAEVLALWNSVPGVRASETPEEFARILERNAGLGLVVRDGGKIVGGILACHDGRRGYLYHLAVAPSHRRQGIARAMVDESLAGLAAAGISRCSIFLVADNETGADFWRNSGWRERTDLRLMAKDF